MLNETQKELLEQTDIWYGKASLVLKKTKAVGVKGEEFLVNINAYMSDTNHFKEKEDFVRAFEAVVWVWAWLEIGKDAGFLEIS
ncbi:MAG: DUF357 domain-containing protein [Candidatus Aenigmarchaeota archaeon]|nr:DUF357 domain-containing protein [Candidatus Aenigmarchaeota archaeon]